MKRFAAAATARNLQLAFLLFELVDMVFTDDSETTLRIVLGIARKNLIKRNVHIVRISLCSVRNCVMVEQIEPRDSGDAGMRLMWDCANDGIRRTVPNDVRKFAWIACSWC